MKTYLLPTSSLLLFICLILLVSQGCKDITNDNNPASYRLTGLVMYDGAVLMDSATYKYQGNKLSEGVDYSNNYQDPVQGFYNYPDENSMVVISFNNTQKYEYTYLNGQMTGMLLSDFNNNIWEPQQQNTYQYLDGKLVEEIWYFGADEGLKPSKKYIYEYEGSKIIRSRIYFAYNSIWQETIKEEAIYTGDLITKIIRYAFSDSVYIDYNYIDLHYDGSLLTGYYYYLTNGNELDFSYVFTYDDHGNMVIRESPERSERIEYVYEEGKGNFQQLSQPGSGISGDFVLPWPSK
jgi:hypothetical protein